MSTSTPNLLLTRLEAFIRAEGLLRLVPKHRRGQAFDIGPALLAAFILFFIGQQIVALRPTVSLVRALLIAIGAIGVGTLISLLLTAIQIVRGKSNFKPETLGLRAMAGIVTAAVLVPSVYLRSVSAFLFGLVSVLIGVILLFVMYSLRFRIVAFMSQIRLAVQISIRAIRLAGVVMPLLILLVFFSVFTEELWSAFYSVDWMLLPILLLLLYIPALLFAKHSVSAEIASALESIPTTSSKSLSTLPPLHKAVEAGLVSREELIDAEAQLSWRDHERLWLTLQPSVRARLNNVLGALSIASLIVLMGLFALYLWLILSILVPRELVATWLHLPVSGSATEVRISSTVIEVSWITFARMKVSTVLALILAIVAHVAGPADPSVREAIFRWLRPKIEQWKSAAFFYDSLVHRDLQIISADERGRILNITAFVSPTASPAEIENACRSIMDQRKDFTHITVRAFHRHPDFSEKVASWRFDSWQLSVNRTTDHYSFDQLPASPPEVHDQHFLGLESIKNGGEISPLWFGPDPEAIELGKALWHQHPSVLLHPYVRFVDESAELELRLTKRLPQSLAYQTFIADILQSLTRPVQQIDVYLYHRDEVNHIAHLNWWAGFMSYKDDHEKKIVRQADSLDTVAAILRSPFS